MTPLRVADLSTAERVAIMEKEHFEVGPKEIAKSAFDLGPVAAFSMRTSIGFGWGRTVSARQTLGTTKSPKPKRAVEYRCMIVPSQVGRPTNNASCFYFCKRF